MSKHSGSRRIAKVQTKAAQDKDFVLLSLRMLHSAERAPIVSSRCMQIGIKMQKQGLIQTTNVLGYNRIHVKSDS